jgi:hypothetical protein
VKLPLDLGPIGRTWRAGFVNNNEHGRQFFETTVVREATRLSAVAPSFAPSAKQDENF